jgi:hypothetical protein
VQFPPADLLLPQQLERRPPLSGRHLNSPVPGRVQPP